MGAKTDIVRRKRVKLPPKPLLATGLAAAAASAGLLLASPLIAAPQPKPSVAARLQALEDYQAIQKLLARYMTAVDSSDWVAYSQIFAKKGELIFQSNHWTGPDEIKAGMSRPPPARPATNPPTPPRQLRHTLTNIDLKIDGDRATGTARWITMSNDANNRPVVGATGYYADKYIREDGEWKVIHRVIYADFPFDDPIANLAKAGKPVTP
jgi:uncharacterized protein (TIGR02246 family)